MTNMKKMMIYALSALAFLSSCSTGKEKQTTNEDDNQESALVMLSQAQYEASDIQLGKMTTATFTGSVSANGSLKILPQDRAEVTSPMGANVRRILVVEGQNVSKGQVLAWLSHPDLIEIQSRYAQAKARISYLGSEYERQKALYAGKAGAGKDLQQAESEYRALEAEIQATGEQLQILGIDPSEVESGRMVKNIAVKSPISGTVERVAAALGQYADPQTDLFTVVNTDRLYADVLVYEKDLGKVKAGQSALLKIAQASTLTGRVASVGRTFDDSNKAVHVRIAIDGDKAGLVAGMYASASIATTPQTAFAVPDEGVAAADSRAYVFVYKPMHGNRIFEPREVKIGRKEGGMTEIVAGLHKGETMAVAGAYTLLSEWKKSEVGEE